MLVHYSPHINTDDYPLDICDPLWYENTSTPLHEACWRGLIDEVQWLIDKFGYSTYHRGLNGWTPLHSASYGGHIEILQLLIDQEGIDPNEGDDNSVSSLHMASYNGHLPVVQYLVDTCHVPPDQPDSSNNTALLYSAMGGHSDLVEFFINRNCNTSQINAIGASLSLLACMSGQVALVNKLEELNLFSPESTDIYGSTMLHYCCMKNNLELFKHLLTQYKLDIDMKNKSGRTPLHFASWFASSSVVEYIVSIQGNEALLVTDNSGYSCLHCASNAVMYIEAGIVYSKLHASRDAPVIGVINNTVIKQNIDFIKRNERLRMFSSLLKKASTCPNFNINATTTDGRSLLHLASYTGSTLLVKALEEYNINPSLDHDGASPVHRAACSGSTSVLIYIILHYNLNDPDCTGRTPLVYSCRSGSINSVQYLINNHKSDPNIIDNNGMTPLHHSCRNGHIDITQYLIEVQHCDINITDNEGHTLLHHAAWSANFDLVQYLITEQGLSPTAVDKNGLTALHYASGSLNLPLVKELITTYQLDTHQSNDKLPIHCAAHSGDILLLELYVKTFDCSVGLTDDNGLNIVHYSSLKGHTHFIKHIVNKYPTYINQLIHSTDNDGQIPLHYACQSGNIQLVTFLIDTKCDVTAKNTCGSTCVMFASLSGNLDLVQLLIQQYKLEPLDGDQYGFTALHAAAENGHICILEWYSQEYSVDITSHCDNNKYTLAHLAAYNGKLHCLQHLINKYQCDVNATTTDTGSTVLHKACEGGHVPVVLYLTSLPQCKVAAKTSNGSTVLHITCQYSGSLPILKYLIKNYQLDLCAVNDTGMAPVHYACLKGRLNLVQYIIEHSSSLELPESRHGHTPFLIAVQYNQLRLTQYLISKKCNLSATDDEGYGAVHISVEKGHLNVLKYLIDNNYCNPDVTDHQNRTPLHVAVVADQFEMLEYLLESMSKAHIMVQDKDGNTPLHLACDRGQQKMVSLLCSAYLSINIKILVTNKKGQTPLHLAAAAGHKDSAEALLYSVNGSSTHQDLLTACDNEGCTVFHTACSNGSLDVFRYLHHVHPEGIKSLDGKERSLLHISCQANKLDMVKALVSEFGLQPESQDKDGITCLHLVAGEGNIEMYQFLMHHVRSNDKAIPRDKSGHSPLHYAQLFNRSNMANYLITSFFYKPDNPDYSGYTSVHATHETGNIKSIGNMELATNLTKCDCNTKAKTINEKTLDRMILKLSNPLSNKYLQESVKEINETGEDEEKS